MENSTTGFPLTPQRLLSIGTAGSDYYVGNSGSQLDKLPLPL